ncbi:MAG: endonuclease III [Thermoplasmata archaeon]|nr:endonuclease III [Thermoplasmata archaeon]MCI4356697.1 endonuclease III [Thermoplasmata archaeon]
MKSVGNLDWESLLDRLGAFYHAGDWRVPYLRDHAEDPFQVLIGTILSQRTRDENTDRASARLFAKYPTPKSLTKATQKQIESLIHETGFYHTKARAIRATSREILTRFGGVVPRTLPELTSLPGVGPKTANCVLVFGYGLPGMPVDTHVHRIANRLGVVRTKTPEETEAALRESVPERYWIPVNPLLVQHGQNLCGPYRPKCPECPISELCATGIALASGRAPPRPEDDPSRRVPRSSARPKPPARASGPNRVERRSR